jgi:Fic family protein
MPPDAPYAPPLTLNPALLNRVAAIAEALGRWSARQDALPSPRLRRENRIHTIQASLAIEQNSLSGDSENWSGGDTKTGPPCGANH